MKKPMKKIFTTLVCFVALFLLQTNEFDKIKKKTLTNNSTNDKIHSHIYVNAVLIEPHNSDYVVDFFCWSL